MDALNFDSKDEVIAAAIRFVEEKAIYTSATLHSARDTKDLLRLRIGDREREIFCVLYLNAQHQLIEVEELFQGTIDGAGGLSAGNCQGLPADEQRRCHSCHNHPSGTTEPSAADKHITERITAALALLDMRVLDHVIVSTNGSFSFAEGGLL